MSAEISVPYKKLGVWLDRVNNTVYQAATDGFVLAIHVIEVGTVESFSDEGNPPTIRRAINSDEAAEGSSVTMPVKKNDYWKAIGADTVYWIPLEP